MPAPVKKSTFAIKKESSYGADPVVAAANIVRIASAPKGLFPKLDKITVDEIANTKDAMASLLGAQRPDWSVDILLRGSGTAGQVPEYDPFLEGLFGAKSTTSGTTVATDIGNTASHFKVASTTGLAKYQGIRVATNPAQVAVITNISGSFIDVFPALTGTPADGTAIGAGAHYQTATAELPSLWLSYWLGDVTRFNWAGNKVESMDLSVATSQIVKPTFGLKGQKLSSRADEACGLGAGTFNSLDPIVGIQQIIKIGSSAIKAKQFDMKYTNELYIEEDVTSSGITGIYHTGRKITGTYNLLYENDDIIDTFINSTTNSAFLVLGKSSLAAGGIVVLYLPKIRYVETPIEEDNKMYRQGVSWEAEKTSGEDTCFMSCL